MNGKINAFISNKLYSKIPVGGIRNRLYSVLLNAENIKIGWNIHIDNINNIFIKRNVLINSWCKFITGGSPKDIAITIGENSFLGPNCLLTTVTHEIGNSDQRAGVNLYKSTKIDEGCWLGANVTVLPGVTIGKGCIVGAGSLVNKSLEENYMYAGVPARKIKYLGDK